MGIGFMKEWPDTTIVRRRLAALLCALATACGIYTTGQTDSSRAGYRRTTVLRRGR